MNADRFRNGIILLTSCCLSALAGYLLALRVPNATSSANDIPPNRPQKSGHDGQPDKPGSSSTQQSRTTEQLTGLKEDLKRKFSEHHNPWMDSTLRMQTATLLSTLSAKELADFHKDVDVPLGESFFGNWHSALAREILRQWGLKDPAAATLAESTSKNHPMAYVFEDWLKRDPAAAEAWVLEGDPGIDAARKKLLHKLLRPRAKDDLEQADSLLIKLPEKERAEVMGSWSRDMANDPEARTKLLALIDGRGDEALREKCYGEIVSAMVAKSPEEAGNLLENSTLSEDAKDRMLERLIGSWAMKSPEDAFRWWSALKEPTARPVLVKAMQEWYFKDRKAPIRIIQSLDQGPARSTFEEAAIVQYARLDDFDGAKQIVSGIKDDASRIRQIRILKRYWDEESKAGASAWLATLPEADQAALK